MRNLLLIIFASISLCSLAQLSSKNEILTKLWPSNNKSESETNIGLSNAISEVLKFGSNNLDTILIVTSNPFVFTNPKYYYENHAELIEDFNDAKIEFEFIQEAPPYYIDVISEYRDTLSFIGQYTRDYSLSEGIMYSNQLIKLPKGLRIGSSIIEFENFIRLNCLGIQLPKQLYLTVILTNFDIPKNYYYSSNSNFYKIIVDIWEERIVRIKFGDGVSAYR